MSMLDLYTIAIFLIMYLICSINPAIIICKLKTGEDIRKLGSGNAGSANAMRVLGKPLGLVVVIFDVLKVFAAYYICAWIAKIFSHSQDEVTFKVVFILATVIGHVFPVYYHFKGGKGVIVGVTVIFILEPQNAIICIVASLLIFLYTKTPAKATLSGLILYVIISLVKVHEYLLPVLISSAIIMFKHRSNIYRIITKQEEKIKF